MMIPRIIPTALAGLMIVTPAFSQEGISPNIIADLDWTMSAQSYATAGMCARKRFSFSSGDVEKLKKIAVEKAKSVDQSVIDKTWDDILFALVYAPPTATQCFDAYEKADFTGLGGFGLFR